MAAFDDLEHQSAIPKGLLARLEVTCLHFMSLFDCLFLRNLNKAKHFIPRKSQQKLFTMTMLKLKQLVKEKMVFTKRYFFDFPSQTNSPLHNYRVHSLGRISFWSGVSSNYLRFCFVFSCLFLKFFEVFSFCFVFIRF